MEQQKRFERSDEQKRAERIYGWICRFIVIIGIALLFVHWKYFLCAAGFLLWTAYFYEKGCQEWVVDEYEQDGYPTQGLYRMFRSWIAFAVLAAAAFLLLEFGVSLAWMVLTLGALAFLLYIIFF